MINEKDGEARFLVGIKIQQLIFIVCERLNMTRRELLRLSEIALTYNKLWATNDNNCFRDIISTMANLANFTVSDFCQRMAPAAEVRHRRLSATAALSAHAVLSLSV